MKREKLTPTKPDHHPMQPLFVDGDGVIRFRPNALVRFLLEQLIGYSASGWGELSYVNEGCPEWLACEWPSWRSDRHERALPNSSERRGAGALREAAAKAKALAATTRRRSWWRWRWW